VIANISTGIKIMRAGYWWFMPEILATWVPEIGRIMTGGQLEQIVHETLSPK
jgi:hypothetical protein